MLLAALLLGTASAFAQSGNNEPLKGDVNGDGKVDVADITAVIKIMKDGGGTSEETKYYFYVGTTAVNPTNYKTIANQVTTIPESTTISLNEQQLFIVAPSTKTVTALTSDGDVINLNTYDPSTGTFTRTATTLGDGYTLYASRGTSINDPAAIVSVTSAPQTVYYSYVGTDTTGKLVDPATGALKSDIATQIKTISGVKTYTSIPSSLPADITITAGGNYVYVIAPTTTLNNATIYLVNLSNMNVSTETLGTFSIGSTEYTVKCTPSEVGTIKTAWK